MGLRIGLMGGTFDPIHCGHLLVAERSRESLGLDSVWFLPAGTPPHKRRGDMTDFSERAGMVAAAIEGNPAFRLEPLEGERSGPSYTLDTLVELYRRHPGHDFWFILGADGIVDLPNWYRPADVLELCSLCIVLRPGFPPPDVPALAERLNLPGASVRHALVDSPQVDFSSREIRARCREGKSIRYMVPEAVGNWIEVRQLYAAQRD